MSRCYCIAGGGVRPDGGAKLRDPSTTKSVPMTLKTLTAAALMLGLTASSALANAKLRNDPVIERGLFEVKTAMIIAENCPDLAENQRAGEKFLVSLAWRSLTKHGVGLGSAKEYVNDPAEVARMEDRAMEYLTDKGAQTGDAASFCAVGQAEMAAKSKIGSFLKAR